MFLSLPIHSSANLKHSSGLISRLSSFKINLKTPKSRYKKLRKIIKISNFDQAPMHPPDDLPSKGEIFALQLDSRPTVDTFEIGLGGTGGTVGGTTLESFPCLPKIT